MKGSKQGIKGSKQGIRNTTLSEVPARRIRKLFFYLRFVEKSLGTGSDTSQIILS